MFEARPQGSRAHRHPGGPVRLLQDRRAVPVESRLQRQRALPVVPARQEETRPARPGTVLRATDHTRGLGLDEHHRRRCRRREVGFTGRQVVRDSAQCRERRRSVRGTARGLKFFFDNDVSFRIAGAIACLSEAEGDTVVHIKDKYGPDAKDPDWLPKLGA
ncbi:MAG: hypothetical protein KJ062_08355, partial [Thermoanaerobaculia bacterium]|nr:hypothetical protein [Thermoanaerobaculia bacterium]